MLKEHTEYSNSIKKTQAEMMFTLSEIKKNLQGTNSEEDKGENQINNLEQKEEMKVTLSEIKKNLQGTNSEGEEARIQITVWNIGKK